VIQRGKAALGDKTMVDAISPALGALKDAVQAGKSNSDALALSGQPPKKGCWIPFHSLPARDEPVTWVKGVQDIKIRVRPLHIFY